MVSLWSENTELPSFPKLEGDRKTDVLIIGGGIAGILCAYFLQQKGVDYILAESRTICSGTTKNTTAKITAQHKLVYDKMIRKLGIEKTKMYLNANMEAIDKFKSLCSNNDCDFEVKDSYVYSLDNQKKIEKEVLALQKLGVKSEFYNTSNLPFDIAGAVKFPSQAQFNPLRFISKITRDLNIFEHTHVSEMTEHKAITNNGSITAKKIIVATHFPFVNKHGSYFIKQFQHRSYVIALDNAGDVGGMYIDENKKGMSFRNYKNYLFVGGGAHRTGKTGGSFNEIQRYAQEYYPNANMTNTWSAQDCITLDQIPYIGQYSKRTPDFYVCTGFNKWGMTSSMISAMILSDMVVDQKSDYSEIFSPSRNILKPQLFVNVFEVFAGMLTPTTRRCPHLGCGLKWNSAEHSWDCTCHGSRFDTDGNVLDNPANKNIK